SYLLAEYDTAWADCQTKSLAERLFKCLQTLQNVLCWVHGAILTSEKENRSARRSAGAAGDQAAVSRPPGTDSLPCPLFTLQEFRGRIDFWKRCKKEDGDSRKPSAQATSTADGHNGPDEDLQTAGRTHAHAQSFTPPWVHIGPVVERCVVHLNEDVRQDELQPKRGKAKSEQRSGFIFTKRHSGNRSKETERSCREDYDPGSQEAQGQGPPDRARVMKALTVYDSQDSLTAGKHKHRAALAIASQDQGRGLWKELPSGEKSPNNIRSYLHRVRTGYYGAPGCCWCCFAAVVLHFPAAEVALQCPRPMKKKRRSALKRRGATPQGGIGDDDKEARQWAVSNLKSSSVKQEGSSDPYSSMWPDTEPARFKSCHSQSFAMDARIRLDHLKSGCKSPSPSCAVDGTLFNYSCQKETWGSESKEEESALDLVELLDVEDEEQDEESWLYESPKKQMTEKNESALRWCRHVLDNPSPEVEAACRLLISRLDESKRAALRASAAKRSCQSPNLVRLHQQVTQYKLLKLAQSQASMKSNVPLHSVRDSSARVTAMKKLQRSQSLSPCRIPHPAKGYLSGHGRVFASPERSMAVAWARNAPSTLRVHVAVAPNGSELFALLIFTELDLGEYRRASPPCFIFFIFLLLLADAVFFSISHARGERIVALLFTGIILSVGHEQVLVQHAGLSWAVRSSFLIFFLLLFLLVVHPSARWQQHLLLIIFVLKISFCVLCLESQVFCCDVPEKHDQKI
ncbi:hypothetical protein INR49_015618, partial [Caranx melampygus]